MDSGHRATHCRTREGRKQHKGLGKGFLGTKMEVSTLLILFHF